jgi:hypothetical protein
LDIEQQLFYEIKQLRDKNCIINICNVNGHQDKKKGKEITYEDIWNVEVDRSTHIALTHKEKKEYDHFPANKVQHHPK